MYIKVLLRLIFGYVKIEVEGYFVERFINICTIKKIFIWKIKRINGAKVYINIGVNDFKRLREISKKTKCNVKIIKKRGLPFIINRYRKRKIFFISLIIISILINISSRYVWNVDIAINNNETLENIESDIQDIGIKKGILKSSINEEEFINRLRIKRDDIAWVGIDIEGTSVFINIVKAKETPEVVDNSDYCNIVANQDGTIESIVAQNGTRVVSVGDNVKKGDILIAGYMEGKYTGLRDVHALGEVYAIVKYSKSEKIEYKQENYKETGNTEKKYEIEIGEYKIKFYKNISKFEYYDTKVNEYQLKIWKNFYIPITIKKIENCELNKEEKEYTKEEAINIAQEDLNKQIESRIDNKNDIVDKANTIVEGEGYVEVTVTFNVKENIGKYEKIKR